MSDYIYIYVYIYIDKNVNKSTTVCLLRSLRSLALNTIWTTVSIRLQQCIHTLALNYQNTMCLVRATRSPCNGNLFLVGGRSERDSTTAEKEKKILWAEARLQPFYAKV